MKLIPIKYSSLNCKNYCKNLKFSSPKKDLNFNGAYNHEPNIETEIDSISNSEKFKKEMAALRKKSLENRVSFDDYIAVCMHTYNKHASYFPIKEDFFEHKAKARFIQVAKKCLDHEIQTELYDFLKQNYSWGYFTGKKYGGSESFATAIPCVLPYLKKYESEVAVLNLRDLEKKEFILRKEINEKSRIIGAKEQLTNEYLKLAQITQNDSTLKLPNAIMLECKDRNITNELVQWISGNSFSKIITVGVNFSDSNLTIKNKIKSALENASKTYENYHIPTLIYCENFDKLLQDSNPKSEIAAMKALLTNTYEKYHATIMFTTVDSNKIENALKQPHRMKQIVIN